MGVEFRFYSFMVFQWLWVWLAVERILSLVLWIEGCSGWWWWLTLVMVSEVAPLPWFPMPCRGVKGGVLRLLRIVRFAYFVKQALLKFVGSVEVIRLEVFNSGLRNFPHPTITVFKGLSYLAKSLYPPVYLSPTSTDKHLQPSPNHLSTTLAFCFSNSASSLAKSKSNLTSPWNH